ncbi:MAG: 50S ribosomal protein L9 [Crocinitomicaceae bacterium]|nr:50S ribosomal protein L9 [Crocinitomicaceae bacterium]
MDVILKKTVDNLGFKDEMVTVKPGFGRNFLIPQGYAILATASEKKSHAEMLKQRAHKESKMLAEAEGLAAKINELSIKIATKAGENGKIFGSVNTLQIAEALKTAGFDIDRKALKIKDDMIKEVGTYDVDAKIAKGVMASFKIEVVGE